MRSIFALITAIVGCLLLIKKKQQVDSCFFDQSQTICSGCAYKTDDRYIPNGTLLNVLTVYRFKTDHRKTV